MAWGGAGKAANVELGFVQAADGFYPEGSAIGKLFEDVEVDIHRCPGKDRFETSLEEGKRGSIGELSLSII